MDPLIGIAAAGVGMVVVYRLVTTKPRPAKGSAKNPARQRTSGASGKLPQRSWLVKAYNSSGARKVESGDLHGASAELTGRALGSMGRRSAVKWSRRWRIVKTAAERSHTRRQKRWQETGGPSPPVFRRPKTAPAPAAAPAKPTPAPQATPGPEPPKRHLKAVPDPASTPGAAMTATDESTTVLAAPDAPPDWALIVDRIRGFVPEDDAALIAFMRGESAAVLQYAEALEQARENAINEVGLDPSAVAGFTTYSEHVSDAAERMAEAYKTFVAVYGQVQELAANGIVMPHNGRWFTGNTA